ncbi:hypothetical protein ACIQVO_37220 [Streptomyces sp. NPDC101062]|uniref:hypothetical protein n=1 Tax=unclassified Streptomyces TaxID=2593676 RepID=UPI0038254F90
MRDDLVEILAVRHDACVMQSLGNEVRLGAAVVGHNRVSSDHRPGQLGHTYKLLDAVPGCGLRVGPGLQVLDITRQRPPQYFRALFQPGLGGDDPVDRTGGHVQPRDLPNQRCHLIEDCFDLFPQLWVASGLVADGVDH